MYQKFANYIKKHEILSFIVMVYICSWAVWGILYSSCAGIISKSIHKEHIVVFVSLGSIMPSIISIVLTGFIYKKKGLKQLFIRLTKWRFNIVFYIFVLGYYPLIYYIIVLIYNTMNNGSKIRFGGTPHWILVSAIWILIFGGPLGEEIGWRGFLLPRLQGKFSPFIASLVIGIIWACWHLPLFFIVGTVQNGTSFPLFVLSTLNLTLQITWVFNRTKGSLIFPILFHTASNTAAGLIYGLVMPLSFSFVLVCIIVQLIITVFIVIDMINNKLDKVVNTNNYLL